MSIFLRTDAITEKSSLPQNIYSYYADLQENSGFITDIYKVLAPAEAYLGERVAEYKKSQVQVPKLAVVLDIDETAISNYQSIKHDKLSNSPSQIDARYHSRNTPAITPMLQFYKKAKENKVDVFFVTSRKPLDPKDDIRTSTIENLNHVGYSDWAGLYMPQVEEFNLPQAVFKANVRKTLTEQGYKILLNISDQECDFEGGYAECDVKLPNLLYGTANAGFFKRAPENTINEDGKVNAVKNTNCQ